MDNYPKHLAPEFEKSGAVKTPFDEWWERVKPSFSTIPDNVAREWLHRHWKHSPYSYLVSKNYMFALQTWPKLQNIRTLWSDFKAKNEGALRKGKELVKLEPGWMPFVSRYMLEHSRFPAPIIVLDNRDRHHNPYLAASSGGCHVKGCSERGQPAGIRLDALDMTGGGAPSFCLMAFHCWRRP